MNKHFHLKIGMFTHLCNLADAKFSGRHDTGHSIRFPLVRPVCRNNRHLGTRMDIQSRKCLMNKLHHPNILNNYRIQSIVIKRQKKIIQMVFQFFVCQKRIDSKVYFLVPGMGKIKNITLSMGSVKSYAQISLQSKTERSQPAKEASSHATSKCFMFIYFLLPH